MSAGPRAARVAVAALVLAAGLAALAPTADAATTRALTITAATAQPVTPWKGFDGNPAKAFDLDGDGRLEILAQNDNHRLYVFSSANGARLAELMTTFPAGWGARTFNGPEAYRDASGTAHIVLANSAGYITSFRYDAAGSTATSFKFVKEWERRANDCFSNPGMDAKPTLADLDRDGRMEILAATEENGIVALRADGSLYWKKCIGGGNGEPAVADLNLDGWPDVVHASDGGVVTAMNGRTGATMWGFHAPSRFNIGAGSMPVGPGIGQLDGVGGPDIVVGARDAHDAVNYTNNHALLLALDSNGKLLWGTQDAQANPLTYTHPIVADADGDGTNEVYWGDWNTMGHKPPPPDSPDAWKALGPANYYRFDNKGNVVWRQTLGSFWSNKDIALADVDGDGQQEVLANGPNGGHDGIWYLNAATGAKETFVDLYPWMMSRGPVLYDMAGTGTMQFIVETGPMATNQGPAVMLFDTGVPFNALWPHLPENGPGTPPPPPPPPAGCFAATFTVKSPNAWWQEVTVSGGGKTIAKVEVRWPGHEWQPMTKSSWGAWTSSHNTPAGTQVEFLATSSDNFVSTSQAFTWMDGTLSKGSVPCGGTTTTSTSTSSSSSSTTSSTSTTTSTTTTSSTSTSTGPGGLTASFTVPSGANEWWVEVAVQADQPLQSVEAKAGSGAWTALARTDWGTWAKSFHVPAGTAVQFRATSTTGAQAVSPTFTWMGAAPPPPPPPPPGNMTATFQPQAVGNDWWIEVKVTASEPLAGVEAKLGTGAWTPLTLQSWGTWAKSLHAPYGTPVQFRATSTDGDVVVSGTTVWT